MPKEKKRKIPKLMPQRRGRDNPWGSVVYSLKKLKHKK